MWKYRFLCNETWALHRSLCQCQRFSIILFVYLSSLSPPTARALIMLNIKYLTSSITHQINHNYGRKRSVSSIMCNYGVFPFISPAKASLNIDGNQELFLYIPLGVLEILFSLCWSDHDWNSPEVCNLYKKTPTKAFRKQNLWVKRKHLSSCHKCTHTHNIVKHI